MSNFEPKVRTLMTFFVVRNIKNRLKIFSKLKIANIFKVTKVSISKFNTTFTFRFQRTGYRLGIPWQTWWTRC